MLLLNFFNVYFKLDLQDEADIVRSYEELRALRDIAVFQLMKERGQLPVHSKDKERKASKDEIGPGTMKTLEKIFSI